MQIAVSEGVNAGSPPNQMLRLAQSEIGLKSLCLIGVAMLSREIDIHGFIQN